MYDNNCNINTFIENTLHTLPVCLSNLRCPPKYRETTNEVVITVVGRALWQTSLSPVVPSFSVAGEGNSGFGPQPKSVCLSFIPAVTGARELALWRVNLAGVPFNPFLSYYILSFRESAQNSYLWVMCLVVMLKFTLPATMKLLIRALFLAKCEINESLLLLTVSSYFCLKRPLYWRLCDKSIRTTCWIPVSIRLFSPNLTTQVYLLASGKKHKQNYLSKCAVSVTWVKADR